MLHVMGETYGLLPSEILKRGDTFDMLVFDVANTVREYREKKNSKDPTVKADIGQQYDPKQLEEALTTMRG